MEGKVSRIDQKIIIFWIDRMIKQWNEGYLISRQIHLVRAKIKKCLMFFG